MTDSDNTFSELQTNGGISSSGGMVFNHEAATTMAQQCANMWNAMKSASDAVGRATGAKALNQRDSGAQLAAKFGAAAANMHDTVSSHQTILTDMGETFVSAGALYSDVDASASAKFRALCSGGGQAGGQPGLAVEAASGQPGLAVSGDNGQPGLAVSDRSGQPGLAVPGDLDIPSGTAPLPYSDPTAAGGNGWSGTGAQDYGDAADLSSARSRVAGDGTQFDQTAVAEDRGAQYEWDDFYNHGRYIDENSVIGQLKEFAQYWSNAKAALTTQAGTFRSSTDQYLHEYVGNSQDTDGIWASAGAQKAKAAVVAYLDNLTKLTNCMDLMSTNLASAQSWLQRVQSVMPDKPIAGYADLSDKDVRDRMMQLRQSWDNLYVEGVKESSAGIPLMPDPKAAIAVTALGANTAPESETQPQAQEPQPQAQEPQPQAQEPSNDSPEAESAVQETQPVESEPAQNDPDVTDSSDQPQTTDPTRQTLQSLSDQANAAVQAGVQAAESAVEQVNSAIDDAVQNATTGARQSQDYVNQQLQNFGLLPGSGSAAGGQPAGSPISSVLGNGSFQAPRLDLFPRAGTLASESVLGNRAGLDSNSDSAAWSSPIEGGFDSESVDPQQDSQIDFTAGDGA
ncbi:hypothetical protein [Nocardia jejuensis]|uniref:hypothetical protein n=1 Tax=Nocardia jejuensis TaxID=328049 RepID=UPI00082B6F4E|nr:hypothetical protein [Nocardia jejuensis]